MIGFPGLLLRGFGSVESGGGGGGEDGGSGGTVQVILNPVVAQVAGEIGKVGIGTTVHAYHNRIVPGLVFGVVDSANLPIDLTAFFADLSFVVFTGVRPNERVVGELIDDNLVLDPDSSNQFTVLNTQLLTTKIGDFKYQLVRRTTLESVVEFEGDWFVHPSPAVTPIP